MIEYENLTPLHIGTLDGCFSLEGIVACNNQPIIIV